MFNYKFDGAFALVASSPIASSLDDLRNLQLNLRLLFASFRSRNLISRKSSRQLSLSALLDVVKGLFHSFLTISRLLLLSPSSEPRKESLPSDEKP